MGLVETSTFDALKATWEAERLAPLTKRFPERRERFTTSSDDIEVRTLYTPADLAGDAPGELAESAEERYLRTLGFPGDYPLTRGVQPNMYRGRLWTMRQYAGFGTAGESNTRYKYLIAQGQTGLSVAFDLPTQIGYDADHDFAEGEVGKVGVSISSLQDMETLLDGIALDKVSISMTINAPAAVLLAMTVAVAKKQGVPVKELRGTVQNDLLKEYIARGTYIYPPGPSMRLITDIFRYCAAEIPVEHHLHQRLSHPQAGSTAVQEVAFTLANGIAYVQQAIDAGLDVDRFAGQLSFFFNAHNNFSKRSPFARRGACGRRSCAAPALRSRKAGGCASTRRRAAAPSPRSRRTTTSCVTLQALAGAGRRHAKPAHQRGDEALALPTEHAVEIALRTQQIIAHESGAADTVDPRRLLLHRVADRRDRTPGQRLHRPIDELGGAWQRSSRATSRRDPRGGLQDSARHRKGRSGRGRRESLPDGRGL